MENPKVVLLIFTSGKIVLAGAKTRLDVYTAYQKIYPVLYSFKKRNNMSTMPQGNTSLAAVVDSSKKVIKQLPSK